ncbi:very-long-chain enoyl-CoA reductase-like isoform X3 [Brienomyrus brachyistius]|uniref:very-long-chain enoyl-CoA reductase-like isoform X3 n=1 Tax=Brienomyrus brachyistius TaxID=42636 RepID=UPI0020B417F8|nr:very-long-chain enoyl-CoA reductase-like isoform X3 [Brienomyrus brachyistius]
MGSLALNSLFTVAHFIKARCEHGLKAGELKDKNYIFFEVEILDYKTNKQLCFLDKVEPHATIKEIKSLLYKCYPKLYPARQSLKLHPKGNALKDDDILENLPVGTTATMYFKDLGPQLGWTMNCLYYWGFSAWLAYYINHPLYTPPTYGNQQVHYALLMFVLCEAGNFSINLTLNNMKTSGSLLTRFPYPTRNPFTWLFFFVSCPNYTYEVGTWIGFTIMTQCAPVAVYTLVGFIQMTIWARGKHKTYMQQFRDYPGLRMAIIPLFL